MADQIPLYEGEAVLETETETGWLNMTRAWSSAALLLSAMWNSAPGLGQMSSTATSGGPVTAVIDGVTHTYAPQFTVPAAADNGVSIIPNIQDPQAVDAQTVCPGYRAEDITNTKSGFTAQLRLAGDPCNVYGTDIELLNLTFEYQSADRLHLEILPALVDASNYTHYVLADDLALKPAVEDDYASPQGAGNDLDFSWSNDPTFGFTVKRRSNGDTLFSTQGKKLVYENQFIEFASDLPENYNLYGLTESIHAFRLGNNYTRTFYATDSGDTIDTNLYGMHPYYLDTRYYEIDASGKKTLYTGDGSDSGGKKYESYTHGVYLRNAHGMEVLLRPENVTWRTIGGSIDLFVYAGPTPKDVTTSYIKSAAGLPAMQQYFTFGYHQCRWGYKNWTELQDVVDNFEKFGIPLENIWTDLDYMNDKRDFENDQNTFGYAEGQQFLKKLHDGGRHYIPIIDAAIYHPNANNDSDAYPTFDRGNASNAFLRNPDGSLYIGTVWPGYTVFPDWFSEGADEWWKNEVTTYHKNVPIDGIWIDMNEASSFCVGSCGSYNISLNPVRSEFGIEQAVLDYPEGFNLTNATEAASASSASVAQAAMTPSSTSETTSFSRTTPTANARDINYPPYAINNVQGDLAVHAVSPNATHEDGSVEYDRHNLYGLRILNATYHALLNVFPTKRPFIIGRSTFVGAGTIAGHWGGDNYAQWRYMYLSIPQALQFSLAGIPMFGVDACGFAGNADEELCNRWMQLSAFFPFYRNHNTQGAAPQEPYTWASVIDATKSAMDIRFSLLPYLYTLFYDAHTTGATVMRALAWEFPNEPNLANVDRQFLLGPSILVTPVLEQGAVTVDGSFPGLSDGVTTWYDWYTSQAVSAEPGVNTTIQAPLGHIPLYLRGGSIIATQGSALTTRDARTKPFGMLVALDRKGKASGHLYLDDGESVNPEATLLVTFNATSSGLTLSSKGDYAPPDNNPLANVTVMGLTGASSTSFSPSKITLNGAKIDPQNVEFDKDGGVLTITGLETQSVKASWLKDLKINWA